MRIVVQKVKKAEVVIDEKSYSSIGHGIAAFVGISRTDTITDIKYSLEKLINLRIFEDSEGKMNLSLLDVKGELLVVSNFTVYGDTRKGRRPSYIESASPEEAEKLYSLFLEELSKYNIPYETGKFREHMNVILENDGPVTLIINSKE
ncbi:D-aminoacyl-tRNA deacylase [Sebaldella sp. S0638]|uniref:D-aminoacyl-tRNA deacylase n=1 Tax=Sebaldella sp. S0638 TaxID=2957809 RepID=UPI00209DFF0D|nr:D-aminoacyl-tRNA deacylase [Sebaldella sp. S0638]MCP1223723.1 D-aminoacyl-tRNA deacylase [Sebaldella sp. S0638]